MTDMMDISNKYVLINSIPVKGPYVIDVVGNQEKIEEVLGYKNSYINKVISKGNEVYIYRVLNLKVQEYKQKRDKNKMAIDYLLNNKSLVDEQEPTHLESE